MPRSKALRALMTTAALGLFVALFGACSDAETPNAGWSAPLPDGGTGGGRDEPCINSRCNSDDLVCVQQGDGANQTLTCRLLCDDNAADPCGYRSTCRTLRNDQTACLPAGLLDEPCPCDEGFACVNLGDNVCKVACEVGVDGGPDTCGDDEGTCFPFRTADGGTRDDGVCLTSDPTPDDAGTADAG